MPFYPGCLFILSVCCCWLLLLLLSIQMLGWYLCTVPVVFLCVNGLVCVCVCESVSFPIFYPFCLRFHFEVPHSRSDNVCMCMRCKLQQLIYSICCIWLFLVDSFAFRFSHLQFFSGCLFCRVLFGCCFSSFHLFAIGFAFCVGIGWSCYAVGVSEYVSASTHNKYKTTSTKG